MTGIYAQLRRKNNHIVAAVLIGSVLIICAGVAGCLLAARAARIFWSQFHRTSFFTTFFTTGPPVHWGDRAWALILLGVLGLAFVLYDLLRGWKFRKSMKDFRVDEGSIYYFEREYRYGERKRIGKIVLTDNWLLSTAVGSTCLLPLREIAWFYSAMSKNYQQHTGEYWVCSVALRFSNGAALHVKCDKSAVDRTVSYISKRCPQAQFGWSREREQAWKEGAKQWRANAHNL